MSSRRLLGASFVLATIQRKQYDYLKRLEQIVSEHIEIALARGLAAQV